MHTILFTNNFYFAKHCICVCVCCAIAAITALRSRANGARVCLINQYVISNGVNNQL